MTNPCGMHLRTEVPAHGGPKTLSAAPIRATTVKRAYGSSPVTTRAAGLGQLFFWILSSQLPGVFPPRGPGSELERPQPRSGEDERA